MRFLQPQDWVRPRGYANGVVATGSIVCISGQIGWDGEQKIVATDFVEQSVQALRNVLAVLAEAGGKPEHIVRMTWYVVDKREYRENGKALGIAYRALMGDHYPAMTVVQVSALLEDEAKVEIEATAVL